MKFIDVNKISDFLFRKVHPTVNKISYYFYRKVHQTLLGIWIGMFSGAIIQRLQNFSGFNLIDVLYFITLLILFIILSLNSNFDKKLEILKAEDTENEFSEATLSIKAVSDDPIKSYTYVLCFLTALFNTIGVLYFTNENIKQSQNAEAIKQQQRIIIESQRFSIIFELQMSIKEMLEVNGADAYVYRLKNDKKSVDTQQLKNETSDKQLKQN